MVTYIMHLSLLQDCHAPLKSSSSSRYRWIIVPMAPSNTMILSFSVSAKRVWRSVKKRKEPKSDHLQRWDADQRLIPFSPLCHTRGSHCCGQRRDLRKTSGILTRQKLYQYPSTFKVSTITPPSTSFSFCLGQLLKTGVCNLNLCLDSWSTLTTTTWANVCKERRHFFLLWQQQSRDVNRSRDREAGLNVALTMLTWHARQTRERACAVNFRSVTSTQHVDGSRSSEFDDLSEPGCLPHSDTECRKL